MSPFHDEKGKYGIPCSVGEYDMKMKKISTDELRQKEIINLFDGARLGYACEFEFDISDGHICALIVPKSTGFLGLGRECSIVIPWCRIECVGEDTILVKLSPEECVPPCDRDPKRRGKV